VLASELSGAGARETVPYTNRTRNRSTRAGTSPARTLHEQDGSPYRVRACPAPVPLVSALDSATDQDVPLVPALGWCYPSMI